MSTSLNRHTVGEDPQRNHLANGQRAIATFFHGNGMVDNLL